MSRTSTPPSRSSSNSAWSRATVAAFALHWIDTTLQASERKRVTKVMYAGVARTHIVRSSLANVTLNRVRPSHVEGWIVELRRKGLAESTVRSAYTILRAVLDTAVMTVRWGPTRPPPSDGHG